MQDVELTIEAAPGVESERLDRLTRQLHDDLRSLGTVQVTRKPQSHVPTGARPGLATQLGVLIVSGAFSSAVVKAVLEVVMRRLDRSAVVEATVTWEVNGVQGTVTASGTGVPAEQLIELAAVWGRPAEVGNAEAVAKEGETLRGPEDRATDRN
ncbi:hypothetical protein GCM10023194_35130 [Planotetraspora phitsanulokensis]|uniref:Uncharacterized protein n=1 Tax=Planotetraspora phitsanulokensis TaxID=575192 RepID=A0A8J3U5E5_9ACTN|nr:hypothetical protein [Planotetraspora phitsanulokensis]GII36359.1 hypothetical protein Pph01_13620 [Planotetraspora phitsanulokensis]